MVGARLYPPAIKRRETPQRGGYKKPCSEERGVAFSGSERRGQVKKENRQKREKRRDTEGVWIFAKKKRVERVFVSSFGREDEGESLFSGEGSNLESSVASFLCTVSFCFFYGVHFDM